MKSVSYCKSVVTARQHLRAIKRLLDSVLLPSLKLEKDMCVLFKAAYYPIFIYCGIHGSKMQVLEI